MRTGTLVNLIQLVSLIILFNLIHSAKMDKRIEKIETPHFFREALNLSKRSAWKGKLYLKQFKIT